MADDTNKDLNKNSNKDIDPQETQEWRDSLRAVFKAYGEGEGGEARVKHLISAISSEAKSLGMDSSYGSGGSGVLNTRYQNTIDVSEQSEYPGDLEMEQKIGALVRWNTVIMVNKANRYDSSLGGHIGTAMSSVTLYEVGFNHFFHGKTKDHGGDLLLIQGHTIEQTYARSYLEGVLSEEDITNFRQETGGKGVSSYPHPYLMPTYWQFPTVSMGLGVPQAIFHARFMKYLHARGLANTENRHVWEFAGDGEMQEAESQGVLARAGREKLDNLTIVVNCNLQSLDGLVDSNGKIIQEYEALFHGAGWHVIKAVWGSNWQKLFDKDTTGELLTALEELCDGDYQNFGSKDGAYIRKCFFGKSEYLKNLVSDISDEDLESLDRAGHDRVKVHAAFKAAREYKGKPVAVLVKSVKGFGLGSAGESLNIAHNSHHMNIDQLKEFRDKFKLPITDKQVENLEFYHPGDKSPEIKYLKERREKLGGHMPTRHVSDIKFKIPHYKDFAGKLLEGTPGERQISTTTALARIYSALLKDKEIGKHIVPIFPDETRTFGMEAMFRQAGIYNPFGQRYEPEDKKQVMYYKEATDGQILMEGLNEVGAMTSWVCAATSYSAHGVPMIPFYTYYSMFGFQRIGDIAWMAADSRARGFLIGATAGRTTLNGEGLQHEDGHSHVQANLIPSCVSYDPTYAYEMAVIIWAGMKRMYENHEDVIYYITCMNENYPHHAMPKDSEEGILKGLYLLKPSENKSKKLAVQLLGSGAILRESEAAAQMLAKDFNVAADVWSMTSANELYREAHDLERKEKLNPEKKAGESWLSKCLGKTKGPIIASTDYIHNYSNQLHKYMPREFYVLGTDGFGRSDTRPKLRAHFEVDRYHIAYQAIYALYKDKKLKLEDVKAARKKYKIKPNKINPLHA